MGIRDLGVVVASSRLFAGLVRGPVADAELWPGVLQHVGLVPAGLWLTKVARRRRLMSYLPLLLHCRPWQPVPIWSLRELELAEEAGRWVDHGLGTLVRLRMPERAESDDGEDHMRVVLGEPVAGQRVLLPGPNEECFVLHWLVDQAAEPMDLHVAFTITHFPQYCHADIIGWTEGCESLNVDTRLLSDQYCVAPARARLEPKGSRTKSQFLLHVRCFHPSALLEELFKVGWLLAFKAQRGDELLRPEWARPHL
eukprot:CAMPEP_0171143050 /NCGR_PEP_ID=MMETSP0766_2-20121228/143653_1 /TAXON_ID=439317 /ORGANISM="Gambierdiscus australes, Strain CAWD 149" /LENGTH=253 /DNA_ID=CAMNT_0011606867 /DNA_START=78 /DNA_END=839 /DNA_ORIENTATION=+